ncbi:MAG: heavy-metal-associated domain-containing protein [Bacteroidetes bacterium]|nr:heavy-metal-associated domain-containing protein [Bacteroidota bacterium]
MEKEATLSELMVEGMTCSNCAMGVRKRLEKQGLGQVDVNFATGEVRFENSLNKPLVEIAESIEDLGYKVVSLNQNEKKNL